MIGVAFAWACTANDGATAPGNGLDMLRVVAGDGQSDTVLATLAQPLVVEVRDSTGRIAGGRAVSFTSLSDELASRTRPTAYVTTDVDEGFGFDVVDTTDADGHAKAFLHYSIVAGTARVVVSVPDLQVVDTVSFTVIPGTQATFSLAPHDTTVPPGASYPLTVTVTDRFNNRIENVAPTFTVTAAAVSPSGQVTVDTAIGRASVIASYRGLTDTASATIFPRVPMVGKWYDDNGTGGVARIASDGTGFSNLYSSGEFSLSPHSVLATTSVVFYTDDPESSAKVWIVEPGGTPRKFLPGSVAPDAWPRLSPDGKWIYFVRGGNSLWRARVDGTSLDSLTDMTPQRTYRAPTISPDGRSVAIEDTQGVKIVDVTTKASRMLPVVCGEPRYSPDGTSFACRDSSTVSTVRTDGTNPHTVVFYDDYRLEDFLTGVDWSPDGKWILAWVSGPGYVLFEVSSGRLIPLTALHDHLLQASFVRER